jgi:T5SS/PEP-CTERM-associated repeat protein/autotransporter-associated beta strand protein
MKRTLDRLPSTAALLSAWLCLFTLTAPAAIMTWTNPFGGRWDDPGNWLFGVVPNSPNDTAIFNAREGTAFPVNILGVQSFTVRTLELNNAVGGGPIFETNPGTINLEGAAATINVQNHPVPPTVRSGVFVIIHLLNNATINTIEPDSLLNIEGLEFTGAPGVSLTKIGPGTLEFGSDTAILLTGALNAQSGTTTIFNALANAFYVGTTGSESARVGTLEIVNATVNVSSILTITSGGVLAVGTGFALNGPLVNGTFVPNGPLTASGGTIHTLAPINFPNDVTLVAGGVTLDSNGFNSTFSGAFTGTGAGGVTKINLGTVTLTGTSSFGGDTTVNGGVLNIQGKVSDTAGILGATAGTTGIVNVIGPGSTWINSGGVGVGSSGTGTLNILDRGTVSDNNGTLGASPGSTGTVTVDGVRSMWTNSSNLSVGSAGTGTLNIMNGGRVTDAVGEIGLQKGSAGTVIVDGAGSTWTNSGGLRIGGLRLSPGGTGLLEITNGGTVNAAATTIWNTGTLAVGASFTLNTALLTSNGGTIRTLADTTFPNSAILAGGVILDSNGFNSTFSGVFTGSGGLTKISTGTVILTADNTYSGGTTIEDGVLVAGVPIAGQATSFALGTGDVFLNGGTLRTPSLDPVIINVGGNYTQGSGGTLALGVAGINGSQYDHVEVGGSASLGGTLAVSSLNNFRPVSGNAFEVLRTNGTRGGSSLR